MKILGAVSAYWLVGSVGGKLQIEQCGISNVDQF